jgi:adenylate kinase
MNIIILGPQGSGKSTQAELLAKKLRIPYLSTGELYRKLSEENTKRGLSIKRTLNKGELVSDEMTIDLIKEAIAKPEYKEGFVLEGAPRNLNQARMLGFLFDRVFYLRVADDENLKRLLLRAREDDTEELIKKRLAIYHQETEPVILFYKDKDLLEEVDGERSIEEIQKDILERLRSKRDRHKNQRRA